MNKWFWIEGHSDNPNLGKKGENVDPNLRKYIALNSELHFDSLVTFCKSLEKLEWRRRKSKSVINVEIN